MPGEKMLVVEDVVTTGGSSKEIGKLVKEKDGEVVAYAAICDRRKGIGMDIFEGKPFYKLQKFFIQNIYKPEECPLCAKKIPLYAPGSRYNNTKAG